LPFDPFPIRLLPHVLNVEELLPLPEVIERLDRSPRRGWLSIPIVELPFAHHRSGQETSEHDSQDEVVHGGLPPSVKRCVTLQSLRARCH
jgi:hypothetical protein